MNEKNIIITSEFLEMFEKLKEFVEKNASISKIETIEETVEKPIETAIQIPAETSSEIPSEEIAASLVIKEIADNVSEILLQVQDFTHKDKIINSMHEELQQYKNGLIESIITPLLKAVVREYDKAHKQYNFYLEKYREEAQSELINQLLSEFEMVSFSLLNLLNDYDIESFDFKAGDAHDVKLQRIVEVIETDDTQKDRTVAECFSCGFRNIETARLFRQAEVKIYKLKQ